MSDDAFQPELDDVGMGMAAPTKVVSGPDLLTIDRVATAMGLNRRLSLEEGETLARLDPEGVNILRPALVHRHAGGADAPPHMRCRAYVKLTDHEFDDPHVTFIDVPMDLFDQLPTTREYEQAVGMEPTEDEDWELFCAQLLAWMGERGRGPEAAVLR